MASSLAAPASSATSGPERPEMAAAGLYRSRLDECTAQCAALLRRWNILGYARGTLFLACVALVILGWNSTGGGGTVWWSALGLASIAFLWAAVRHDRIDQRLAVVRLRQARLQCNLARCARDWDRLPPADAELPPDARPVSADLDLFGRASLFQWIGPVHSPFASRLLRDWIITPAPHEEIAERQKAVSELRERPEWREALALGVAALVTEDSGPDELVEWAEGPRWLERRKWLPWFARLTAGALPVAAAGGAAGWIPWPVAGPIVVGVLGLHFIATIAFGGSIHAIFNRAGRRQRDAAAYRDVFRLMQSTPAQAAWLRRWQAELEADGRRAVREIDRLTRVTWLANWRNHGFLFLLYLALQFAALWDVHVLARLEKWQRQNRRRVRHWFLALGHWEVAAALAEIADVHRDWCFPVVAPSAKSDARLEAARLAHPLLGHHRVANDVCIGPPGSILLVTGSNMSGKSTLLRAVGLNAVMAQMGSVVCAEHLRMPPLRVETSMRVHDSLEDGVSFFMAELKRLKQIVDRSEAFADRADRHLLVLLDEVLQGTNSRERHVAVTRVLARLVRCRAVAAVSTHDLDLATAAELADACRPFHFRETFVTDGSGRRRMTFDYHLHDGLATTTNALELLRLVGLDPGPEQR